MYDFFHKFGNSITGIIFTICMTALGYYTIIGQNIERDIFTRLPVRLTTSEGLLKNAKVFIQGVEVGTVGSVYYMELDENGWPREFKDNRKSYGQTVIAILHLKVWTPFYENYTIKTKHATILSAKIVEITPGHASENTNKNNRLFDNKESFEKISPLQLNAHETYLMNKYGRLPHKQNQKLLAARNYDDPLYQIAQVMQDNRRDIFYITRDLRDISQKLNEGTGSLARVLNQPVLLSGINDLLKDVIVLTSVTAKGAEDTRESEALVNFLELLLAISGIFY